MKDIRDPADMAPTQWKAHKERSNRKNEYTALMRSRAVACDEANQLKLMDEVACGHACRHVLYIICICNNLRKAESGL